MNVNKALITNTIAILFILVALFVDVSASRYFLYTGLFALSGAVTNQLAIHMLFERVPLLYGSGVIPNRFESFKKSIKSLMMDQFFTKEQIESFFEKEEKKINLSPIIEKTDFLPAYDALTKTVMESSFGGMLGMFGGEKVLEDLKEPFTNKLKSAVLKITSSESFEKNLLEHIQSSSLSDDLTASIETIIDDRLNQLTPQIVKEIVQELIKVHLGWLVVWGGVFGGLIGLISSFLI